MMLQSPVFVGEYIAHTPMYLSLNSSSWLAHRELGEI